MQWFVLGIWVSILLIAVWYEADEIHQICSLVVTAILVWIYIWRDRPVFMLFAGIFGFIVVAIIVADTYKRLRNSESV